MTAVMRQSKKVAWKTFSRILRRSGIDVYRHKADYHYVSKVYGCKAKKHVDIRTVQPFGSLAADVIKQRRTMLYYDRLYPIYQALSQIGRFADGQRLNVAEVGVFRGGTTAFMAATLKTVGVSASIHSFDTFEGHAAVDITGFDAQHRAGLFSDTSVEAVGEYLKSFDNIALYKGRVQDTCHQVADKEFHFAHLDVDIYDPMLFSLQYFGERLAIGGSIIVDDYGFRTCPGTEKAVSEFMESSTNFFSLHLLSGQCLLVKTRN